MTRYTPQWLQSGSYAAGQDRRLLQALWPNPASYGCAVSAASAMTVNIAPGQVAVPSQNATGTSLCTSDATEQVTLAAAPGSGTNRIDLIVCQPRGTDLDGGGNNDFVFTNVTGTAAATPAVPATPAGAVALAQIYVGGGVASISPASITDVRPHGLGPEVPVAGTTLYSYQDQNGEMWVAKGNVNGGVWRKARDVLIGKWYRAAALSVGTALSLVAYDTVMRDPYGLFAAGAYWLAPVAGWYQVTMCVGLAATASGQYLLNRLYLNGAALHYSEQHAAAASTLASIISTPVYCNSQDQIAHQVTASGTLNAVVGSGWTYGSFAYLGTG